MVFVLPCMYPFIQPSGNRLLNTIFWCTAQMFSEPILEDFLLSRRGYKNIDGLNWNYRYRININNKNKNINKKTNREKLERKSVPLLHQEYHPHLQIWLG